MVTTYSEFKELTTSRKNILAWVHANQRVFNFTNVSGQIYSKTFDYFVVGVDADGVALTDGGDITPANGEFFYKKDTKTLYININENPSGNFVVVKYRLFFSDQGLNYPFDLSSGETVHYEPLILSTSKFSSGLDSDVDQIGIATVGSGSLKLVNTHGYFDDIYDQFQFENSEVSIFSIGEGIAATQAELLYRGKIDSKEFGPTDVSFKLKDPLTVLNNLVPLDLYTSSDGDLSNSDLGTAKRRIYGDGIGVKCVGVSKILEGFNLTGTFSGTEAGTTVTGTSSTLLSELSPGDELSYTIDEETENLTVKTVDSDTQFTTESPINVSFALIALSLKPNRGTKIKNRTWQISGHILKEPATTIVTGFSESRFTIASTTDFFPGDKVVVDGTEKKVIRRITGSTIILETSLSFTPVGGETFVKSPIQRAYLDNRLLTFQTDYTLTNTSQAKIVLDTLAEVNIAPLKTANGTVSISNGSRTLTGVGTDFIRDLRPRDYIEISGVAGSFEVLQIDSETQAQMVVSWAATTQSNKAYKIKSVEYADDNSVISVDCLGITENGAKTGVWVKTAAQVVKHLLTEAGETANIDTSSFTTAENDGSQRMALKVPITFGGQKTTIKDVVNACNGSVFGSLSLTSDLKFKYSILTSKKPASTLVLSDHDILNWKVRTDSRKILNKVIVNYNFKDFDPVTLEDSFLSIEKESNFVNKLIKIDRQETFDVYLSIEDEARIIAERYRFFRELSSSIMQVNAKLNLSNLEVNQTLYFQLDRIFKRFGSYDKVKIGIINRIEKDGLSSSVELNDLSGWFNRIGNIAPNTASVYTLADADDRAFNGYIVDNSDNLTNSSNAETFGINLIG